MHFTRAIPAAALVAICAALAPTAASAAETRQECARQAMAKCLADGRHQQSLCREIAWWRCGALP